MAGFSIKTDVEEVQKALSGTRKSLKSISRQTLGIIARNTVKVIKREIKATTVRRTGELMKAYRYKVRRDGKQANIFPKALNKESTIFPKVMALSYGRKNDRLRPRGFVQKGIDYTDNGNYTPELQKMINKELSKYWS